MTTEFVRVRNLETGQVGSIRRKWFESAVINRDILVEVADDAKPYVPELYKSKIEEPEVVHVEED
jgi:hypothetical protein